MKDTAEVGLGAARLPGSGGKSSPNPMKPTIIDFRADVSKAIKAKLPKDITFERFVEAYFDFDSEDYIEREKYAQKVLGDRRHSAEQRVGAEFVERGLYPCGKYFTAVRGTVTYAKNKVG